MNSETITSNKTAKGRLMTSPTVRAGADNESGTRHEIWLYSKPILVMILSITYLLPFLPWAIRAADLINACWIFVLQSINEVFTFI